MQFSPSLDACPGRVLSRQARELYRWIETSNMNQLGNEVSCCFCLQTPNMPLGCQIFPSTTTVESGHALTGVASTALPTFSSKGDLYQKGNIKIPLTILSHGERRKQRPTSTLRACPATGHPPTPLFPAGRSRAWKPPYLNLQEEERSYKENQKACRLSPGPMNRQGATPMPPASHRGVKKCVYCTLKSLVSGCFRPVVACCPPQPDRFLFAGVFMRCACNLMRNTRWDGEARKTPNGGDMRARWNPTRTKGR